MQDRRKACMALGLSEEAKRQEIEDRYYILLKKYKYLAQDEQPSPSEPIFAVINEAYRFLIGYTPLQKVQFRELQWKDKFHHIRDNYKMEITLFLIMVLFVCAIGAGIHELNSASKAVTKNPNAAWKEESPHPISQFKTNHEN